jgi:hypothetical protein
VVVAWSVTEPSVFSVSFDAPEPAESSILSWVISIFCSV